MSEENTEETTEQTPEIDPEKAEKFGYVDFDELPEEQREPWKKRFNSIYGRMKDQDRELKTNAAMIDRMAKDNRALLDRFEEIDKFRDEIVSGQVEAEASSLESQLEAAHEEGDTKKVAEITRKMTELEVKRSQPKPEKPKTDDNVATTYQQEINQWATERGDDGSLLRPWTQQGHEMQEAVAAAATMVASLPKNRGKPPSQWLDQVDKEVQDMLEVKPSRPAPQVLDSDTSITPKKETATKLSEDEKRVAQRLYPDLDPKKAQDRYAKSKSKL